MLNKELAKKWLGMAGVIAKHYFQRVDPSIKDDKTFVTEADREIQAFLIQEIKKEFPTVGIIAEEDEESDSKGKQSAIREKPTEGNVYYVIDPVDGTASFVCGMPVWGISIGIIDDYQPIAGYFYMPITDDFFYTETTGQVYRNGERVYVSPLNPHFDDNFTLLTISKSHKKCVINADYPGKVRSLGSTIAHICYTASGSADATLVHGLYLWDIASGMAMLKRNHGNVRYLHGDDFVITDDFLDGEKISKPILFGSLESIDYFQNVISYHAKTKET